MTQRQIEQMRINSCRKGLTMYGEYVAGAMDASEWQRKIDIDKAWKWIEWMLGTQSATPDFVEESRTRFTQAMEEEQ